MTLPGVAGNLVVAALFTWVVFDAVAGLVASAVLTGHGLRWWRAALVPLRLVALRAASGSFRALVGTALLLLVGAALAWFSPWFAAWARTAWGPWAGSLLGLLGAGYLVQSSERGEAARAVRRAEVYDIFEGARHERPTIRQQTFLRPYRQAYEERKRREREAAPSASG